MLTFKFSGRLRRHFRAIVLNVDTPSQGLRLLFAQAPEFKKDFLNTRLRIRLDREELDESGMSWHLDRAPKGGGCVLFVPVVEGGSTGLAIAAWVTGGLLVATTSYSVYMMHNMRAKNSAESAQSRTLTNNSYSSAENRVGQGKPVPILLGEMLVGSNVISLGIDTTNNRDWSESIS